MKGNALPYLKLVHLTAEFLPVTCNLNTVPSSGNPVADLEQEHLVYEYLVIINGNPVPDLELEHLVDESLVKIKREPCP